MSKRGVMRDARRSQRLQHEFAVTYRSVGRFLSDWATDISRGGMFVNTRTPLPVGTVVKLVIQLPGTSFPVDLVGRVKRAARWAPDVDGPAGMAIEFTDVDRARRDCLEGLIEKLRDDLGTS